MTLQQKNYSLQRRAKELFLNDQKVSVRTRSDFTILIGGSFERKIFNEKLFNLFSLGTVRVLGSVALHYAYVACGRATVAYSNNKDTFPEFAGKLLVEEAGGIFTDGKGDQLTHECKGIIATSNTVAHAKVLDIVK